jgi:hypothetical protein
MNPLLCRMPASYSPNKALHWTGIPLRSIPASELGRSPEEEGEKDAVPALATRMRRSARVAESRWKAESDGAPSLAAFRLTREWKRSLMGA